MRIDELIEKLIEIEDEHGGHLIVDVFPGMQTITEVKPSIDRQMGLDSLIISVRPRANGES